jgi:hypothetical protein
MTVKFEYQKGQEKTKRSYSEESSSICIAAWGIEEDSSLRSE